MSREEEPRPEDGQASSPPAEEESAEPALPNAEEESAEPALQRTESDSDDDSQPDLLVWGLLALVILGGLTWLFLARRPTAPTSTAVSGGPSTPMAPLGTPASPPPPSTGDQGDQPPPGSGPPDVPPGSGPAGVPPGTGAANLPPGATSASAAAGSPTPGPGAGVPPVPQPPPGAPSGAGGLPVMYIGAEPTEDPATWVYVHGDLLLGALREVDAEPSTSFTPDQLRGLAKVLDEVTPPARELNSLSLELVQLVQGVLDPRQLAGMTAVEETLALQSPDLEALIQRLSRLAATSTTGPAVPPQATQAVYPANFLIAGLDYLEDFQRAPLRAEQAARILPKLQAYSRALRAQTVHYPKLTRLMTPRQVQAFRDALADMRLSNNPPLAERQMTLAEMQLYLDKRLAR